MDWQPLESTWWRHWESLRTFWMKYGHHKVPRAIVVNLYKWVWQQRKRYRIKQDGKAGGLSEDRVNALEEIEFWDEPRQNATLKSVYYTVVAGRTPRKKYVKPKHPNLHNSTVWDALFPELVDFSNQHSHLKVPIRSPPSQTEHRQLAYFCRTCRLHYQYRFQESKKNLPAILNTARIQRLEDLGFELNATTGLWQGECAFNQSLTDTMAIGSTVSVSKSTNLK
jgi:hypothetical protein